MPKLTSLHLPDGFDAPFMAEYFGVWAVKEDFFRAAVERVSMMDLGLHVRTQRERIKQAGMGAGGNSLYRVVMADDGIALVDIRGSLMKQETSLDESTSTVAMRRSIRALASDDNVKGVMIRIESPGGTSAGTQELADDVAALATIKPVHVFIEDLGASAAYWISSQATFLSTNAQGWVGSIGTYATIYDCSAAAAKDGIKVHVVRAGEFKGAGTPGTEITDGQLAEWQRLVDQTNEFFLEGVAAGRGMSIDKVRLLNDGRVYIGADAKSKGLVDDVETFDAAFARLRSAVTGGTKSNMKSKASPAGNVADGADATVTAQDTGKPLDTDAEVTKETNMSQPNTAPATSEPKPATMAELKAACPGAPSDFLVEQAEKNATAPVAKDAFLHFQAAQIRSRDQEIVTLRGKLKSDTSDEEDPSDVVDPEENPLKEKSKADDKKPAEQPAAKRHGVKPIASNAAEASSTAAGQGAASDELDRRAAALMAKSPTMLRSKAVAKVLGDDEELRQNYLAEQKK